MQRNIRVLMVDDNENDVLLTHRMLEKLTSEKLDLHIDRCRSISEALAYLAAQKPDAVLLDLGLPDSHGLATLEIILGLAPSLPVVVFTDLVDEELAIQAVQIGAQDYLVKTQVNSHSLLRSLRYSIERNILAQQSINLRSLHDKINQFKLLKGFLPICSHCKKIRNDSGYWQNVENYISNHSGAKLSHGICPDCLKEHYPDFAKKE